MKTSHQTFNFHNQSSSHMDPYGEGRVVGKFVDEDSFQACTFMLLTWLSIEEADGVLPYGMSLLSLI